MTYWKDTLLIGVPQIDEQHKTLVKAIDELMYACTKGQGRAAVAKTMDFVFDYTKKHFADEEKIQAEYKYPDMTSHMQLHKQFVQNVSDLKKELEQNGASVALTGKINKSLIEWLIYHISIEDKKIGQYILHNVKNT